MLTSGAGGLTFKFYYDIIKLYNIVRGDQNMGYFNALWKHFKTEKARRDLEDYIRAALIIAAVMAMVKIIIDMFYMLL